MHLFDLQISIWVTCFQAFDLTVSSCYYKEAWSSKLGRQLNSLPNQLKKSPKWLNQAPVKKTKMRFQILAWDIKRPKISQSPMAKQPGPGNLIFVAVETRETWKCIVQKILILGLCHQMSPMGGHRVKRRTRKRSLHRPPVPILKRIWQRQKYR